MDSTGFLQWHSQAAGGRSAELCSHLTFPGVISTETLLQWERMAWGEPIRGLYFQQLVTPSRKWICWAIKVKPLTFPTLRCPCQESSMHTRCPHCTLLPECSEMKVSQAPCIPSEETRVILSWEAVPHGKGLPGEGTEWGHT